MNPVLSQNQESQPASWNWTELPPEITASILSRLGIVEILTVAQLVCTTWRKVCLDPSIWRSIDMSYMEGNRELEFDLCKVAKHAVDRSSGGLVEFSAEYFATDDLLEYVVDRSHRLKCLRLISCYEILDERFSSLAAKVPFLEELELSFCSISRKGYEVFGRHCPSLKSFKLNFQGYRLPHIEDNGDALTIAGTMPELRHLQIFGNKLTDTGLLAILDACPHLEFLDLRRCFNVKLTGPLGKRCFESIEDVRGPEDVVDDCPFLADVQDILSSDEDYPSRFSDIDVLSADEDYYEFSDGSDYADPDDFYMNF